MDEFAKVEYSRSQIEKAGKVISKSVGISDENVLRSRMICIMTAK